MALSIEDFKKRVNELVAAETLANVGSRGKLDAQELREVDALLDEVYSFQREAAFAYVQELGEDKFTLAGQRWLQAGGAPGAAPLNLPRSEPGRERERSLRRSEIVLGGYSAGSRLGSAGVAQAMARYLSGLPEYRRPDQPAITAAECSFIVTRRVHSEDGGDGPKFIAGEPFFDIEVGFPNRGGDAAEPRSARTFTLDERAGQLIEIVAIVDGYPDTSQRHVSIGADGVARLKRAIAGR